MRQTVAQMMSENFATAMDRMVLAPPGSLPLNQVKEKKMKETSCSVCGEINDSIVTVDQRPACLHHHGVEALYQKEIAEKIIVDRKDVLEKLGD